MKLPSYTSPIGGRRACLCKDGLTYKIECCTGELHAQGIESDRSIKTSEKHSRS